MPRTSIVFCLMLFSAAQANAQSPTPKELAAECLAALGENRSDRASELATQLRKARNIPTWDTRDAGAECISRTTGQSWMYSGVDGMFRLTEEVDAENQRAQAVNAVAALARAAAEASEQGAAANREAAEQRQAAAREQALVRTVAACRALFLSDEVAALTNPVCHPIFLATGLPD